MRRFLDWLYKKYLPYETRELYEREVASLRKQVDTLKGRNRELEAYIEGMTSALRAGRKIEINNEVNK